MMSRRGETDGKRGERRAELLAMALLALIAGTRRRRPYPGNDELPDRDPDDADRRVPDGRRGLRRATAVTRRTIRGALDDRVSGLAAEVAFFGVLALFPALLAVAATLGSLDVVTGEAAAEDARRQILDWLRTSLTEEASGVVEAVESLFARSSGGVLTVAFAAALFTASRGTNALMRALAIVHGRPDARSFVKRRALALVLLFATVVAVTLVTTAFVVGPLLGHGAALAETFDLGEAFVIFWRWLRVPMVALAIAAWATIVLHLAPDDELSWWSEVPGAVLTTALWGVLTLGLRLYLGVAGDANQVFGILGGVLVVLLWLYLLAISLLVGAELNVALSEEPRSGDTRPP